MIRLEGSEAICVPSERFVEVSETDCDLTASPHPSQSGRYRHTLRASLIWLYETIRHFLDARVAVGGTHRGRVRRLDGCRRAIGSIERRHRILREKGAPDPGGNLSKMSRR